MTYWALEDLVEGESIVRVIDRYIETLDLAKLGFTRTKPAETGRPGYPAGMLAKLYVYGYENGIRSSRKLEKEARCNVEVMWLTEGLTPDYKTIAEFRRLNIRPLQKLFREFVKLCRSWDLVGGKIIATDGSKFKASNNKKNNFSRKKLDDRLKRLEEKIEAYLNEMDKEDKQEDGESKVPEGLLELLSRKELYEEYKARLEETGENEFSVTDPDARLMGNNRGGVDVAYNVQSAVDAKHHIVLNYDVSKNPSDQGYLQKTAKALMRDNFKRFTLLADKGFYNGVDLSKMKTYGIKAIVPRQNPANPKTQPAQFHIEQFQYNSEANTYICPMGETLRSGNSKTVKRYRYHNKPVCAKCPHKSDCTNNNKAGYRTITRNQNSDICDEANRIYKENQSLYKLRQQLVEHPFGTIKHTMNGGHFLLRTRRKVRCEAALLFLGYNLKRAYNVLGFKELMARLDSLSHHFFAFLSPRNLPSHNYPFSAHSFLLLSCVL
jgi:transposase